MSGEIKDILEEMKFKAGIYRDHKKRGLSFNDEEKNCALLLEYIEQKESIIKEATKYIRKKSMIVQLDNKMEFAIDLYLKEPEYKELLEILDKEDI